MAGQAGGPVSGKSGGVSRPPAAWADPMDPRSADHARRVMVGMKAYEDGDIEAAKGQFRSVLDQNIEHPDALFGMGLVARAMGQPLTGAELMRRAIAVHANPIYWSNLGNTLQELEQWDASLTAHAEAFRLNKTHPGIIQNYASTLNNMDRPYEAVPLFRKLARMFPDSLPHLVNYATALTRIGEYGPANRVFRQAQAIDTTNPSSNFHHAANLMQIGDWEMAWRLYDWRFLSDAYSASMRQFSVAPYFPERLDGQSVFLYGEQGVGDEIRFAGMVNEFLERGGAVTFECHRKLLALFRRSFPAARVVEAPYEPAEQGEETFDFYLPTGNLGKLFRNKAEDFPRHDGYLVPDPERVATYRDWLDSLGPGAKIGVGWRSGMRGRMRSLYYATIDDLEPLFRVKGAVFVNLQYDDVTEDVRRALTKFGVTLHQAPELDLFDDLDGAAALTRGLDYVVSANTSTACIAGALGVPGIEFRGRPVDRHGTLDGNDPWFPSIELVGRKAAEPWNRVFRTIAGRIERLVKDRATAE